MELDKRLKSDMVELIEILHTLKGIVLIELSNAFMESDLHRRLYTSDSLAYRTGINDKKSIQAGDTTFVFLGSSRDEKGSYLNSSWSDVDVKYLLTVESEEDFSYIHVTIKEWEKVINSDSSIIQKSLQTCNVVFIDYLSKANYKTVKSQVKDVCVVTTFDELDGHFIRTGEEPSTLMVAFDAPASSEPEYNDSIRILCNCISMGVSLVLNSTWVSLMVALVVESDVLVNSTVISSGKTTIDNSALYNKYTKEYDVKFK